MCTAGCLSFVNKNLSEADVKGKKILEVGSRDVNGSPRQYICGLEPSSYVGCDIQNGKGVDEICDVVDLAYKYGENSFDVVISCEMMEHVKDWKTAINNMKKVVKVGGKIIITTRSPGFHFHEYPNDFWRFTDNDIKSIFSDFNIISVENDSHRDPGIFICCEKKNNQIRKLDNIEVMPSPDISSYKRDPQDDIFIIGAYADSPYKEDILRRQIELIRSTFNNKILVVSHYPLSVDIQKMSDFVIYDEKNIIGKNLIIPLVGWYISGDVEIVYTYPFTTYHAASIVSSLMNSVRFLCGNFRRAFYIESDTFIHVADFVNHSNREFEKGKKFIGVRSDDSKDDICTNFFSFDIEWMKSKLADISTWQEYLDIDYYTGSFTNRGREIVFEDWLSRYFETYEMNRFSTITNQKREFAILPDCTHYNSECFVLLSDSIKGDVVVFILFLDEFNGYTCESHKCRVYNETTGKELLFIRDTKVDNINYFTMKKEDATIVVEVDGKEYDRKKIYKESVYNRCLYYFKNRSAKIDDCVAWCGTSSSNSNFFKDFGDIINKKKKLMIVAHPDDETIFAGNTLWRDNGWKVISVTGGDNYIRKKEFDMVMDKIMNRVSEVWDFNDDLNEEFPEELSKRLASVIRNGKYDIVATHNPDGEYGHIQHKSLFNIVSKIVPHNKLYVFGQGEELSKEDMEMKMELLKLYKSQVTDKELEIPILDSYKKYIYNEKLIPLKYYKRSKMEASLKSIPVINYHFLSGAFLEIISGKGEYLVEFEDADKGEVVFSQTLKEKTWAKTFKQTYTNWRIKISQDNEIILSRDFNLENKKIIISIDSGSLGDNIAWMPYAEEFRKKHNCTVYLSTFWNHLFEKEYPNISFVKPGQVVDNVYASYSIGWYIPWDINKNPQDFRTIPLQKASTDILGLDYKEIRPKISIPDKKRNIEDKYVCIGIHSTAQAKYWNRENGWQEVVDYLREKGYKVVYISREKGEYMGNSPPEGIIDKSGDISIEDRIIDLKYADMYIGIGSGLSWLSWAVGTPTILISGFSAPWCEPQQNVERVYNPNVCNSCFNDPSIEFDKGDWNWCPRKKDFECSRLISTEMVIHAIESIIQKNNL